LSFSSLYDICPAIISGLKILQRPVFRTEKRDVFQMPDPKKKPVIPEKSENEPTDFYRNPLFPNFFHLLIIF
jgi:hypothetical protein